MLKHLAVLTVLLVFATSNVDASRKTDLRFLARDSIVYNLSGPAPFENIRIEFRTENFGSFLKINAIRISLPNANYELEPTELGIDYHPRLDDLFFGYSERDKDNGTLDSFSFRIPHDRKEYVDCGSEGRIGFLKEKRIVINAYEAPTVISAKTPVEMCEQKEGEKYPVENMFE